MIVTRGLYDIGGRKYIDVDYVRYKVLWRYNRVTGVKVSGYPIAIQSILPGTVVDIEYRVKEWAGEQYKVLSALHIKCYPAADTL
jgi:hypothetical protein